MTYSDNGQRLRIYPHMALIYYFLSKLKMYTLQQNVLKYPVSLEINDYQPLRFN